MPYKCVTVLSFIHFPCPFIECFAAKLCFWHLIQSKFYNRLSPFGAYLAAFPFLLSKLSPPHRRGFTFEQTATFSDVRFGPKPAKTEEAFFFPISSVTVGSDTVRCFLMQNQAVMVPLGCSLPPSGGQSHSSYTFSSTPSFPCDAGCVSKHRSSVRTTAAHQMYRFMYGFRSPWPPEE